jgi:hypothetical protein
MNSPCTGMQILSVSKPRITSSVVPLKKNNKRYSITFLVLRIRMFFFWTFWDPDPLVRGTATDPDPSIIKQK